METAHHPAVTPACDDRSNGAVRAVTGGALVGDGDPSLRAEFDEVLGAYQDQGTRLAALAERVVWQTVHDLLPLANTLEVEGWMNEDWLRVLRVRRVLDADGVVLFDVAHGADPSLEEAIDEVGTEYLDLLLDLTGDAFMGHHELVEPSA
jgi:hypothetical protein